MAIARLSRQSPEAEGSVSAQAAPERLVVRNPLAVAQEIRQDLVWKRAGYEKQMAWIGRIVELLDAAIKEQNSQIKWLKG